jgi:hypothetical protein
MSCTGLVDGKPKKFDLTVNTSNGDIFGFPNMVAMGCARIKPDDALNDTNSIDANSASVTCKNNVWRSSLKLSRNSGNLHIITFELNNAKLIQDENFQCKRVEKRLF